MSLIERAVAVNRKKAEHHDPSLANKPAPKIAILTCMDPRMNELLEWLDIKPADADGDSIRDNSGTEGTDKGDGYGEAGVLRDGKGRWTKHFLSPESSREYLRPDGCL
jgi:hypothetical protein